MNVALMNRLLRSPADVAKDCKEDRDVAAVAASAIARHRRSAPCSSAPPSARGEAARRSPTPPSSSRSSPSARSSSASPPSTRSRPSSVAPGRCAPAISIMLVGGGALLARPARGDARRVAHHQPRRVVRRREAPGGPGLRARRAGGARPAAPGPGRRARAGRHRGRPSCASSCSSAGRWRGSCGRTLARRGGRTSRSSRASARAGSPTSCC